MIRTLQLVTTARPFFEQQVEVLERNGVSCTVLRVPGESHSRSPESYVRFYARTLREVAGGEFDLVHANYGLTAPAALAQPVRPVVLSLWGSDLMGRYGRVSEYTARLCDDVVVMSDEMAARLDRDCRVIPHGVDCEKFSPQPRASALEAVGWDPDAAHVLFPYDPERQEKDFPRARRVVERASASADRPVELHAVYDAPHDRIPTYMNAASALLLTSTREGSPNSVKEALACELPVVATPVGDVPDLLDGVECSAVRSSDEGLADALGEVVGSTDDADGRERALELGLGRMESELLSVYDGVLDGRQSARESA